MLTLRDYAVVQEQRKDKARQIARRRLIQQGQSPKPQQQGRYQAMRSWVGRHLVSWGEHMQAGVERLEHSR